MKQVACPVALHPDGANRRIAILEHRHAGLQLVSGGIRTDEPPTAAAARKLYEESGLETRAALSLGSSSGINDNQVWHFALCRVVPPVRDHWQHHSAGDGGQLFKFFWMPLDSAPYQGFYPRDLRALDWIRAAL